MLERAYELLKKYGWPHFFVPIFVMVLIDYVHILLRLVQIALVAYVMLHSLSFVVGFFIGMMVKINDKNSAMWKDLLNYRVAALFPSIGWGCQFFDWILTEQTAKKID